MKGVFLVHWNEKEAAARVSLLRKAGITVDYRLLTSEVIKELRQDVPEAIIVDLSRLPSQGRDVALGFRSFATTRKVPLLFVGGAREKVAGIKKLLPDAAFSDWESIISDLPKAIANPPRNPVVPESRMAGYAGAPLPAKLGIKSKIAVAVLGAPMGFADKLGKLPPETTLNGRLRGNFDLIIWFVKSRSELLRRLEKVSNHLTAKAGLWIAWPKQGSNLESDLTQNVVRRIGLESGLVDHKICAIDETWSALRFVKRKRNPDTGNL